MVGKRVVRILFILAFMALSTIVWADGSVDHAVPEASVFVLAPMGIAAVVAAEKRRRLATFRHGVGVAYFVAKRTIDVVFQSRFCWQACPWRP